ncbi:MAG: hypothetical protein ACRC8K_24170 [Waterburya sp.]
MIIDHLPFIKDVEFGRLRAFAYAYAIDIEEFPVQIALTMLNVYCSMFNEWSGVRN